MDLLPRGANNHRRRWFHSINLVPQPSKVLLVRYEWNMRVAEIYLQTLLLFRDVVADCTACEGPIGQDGRPELQLALPLHTRSLNICIYLRISATCLPQAWRRRLLSSHGTTATLFPSPILPPLSSLGSRAKPDAAPSPLISLKMRDTPCCAFA